MLERKQKMKEKQEQQNSKKRKNEEIVKPQKSHKIQIGSVASKPQKENFKARDQKVKNTEEKPKSILVGEKVVKKATKPVNASSKPVNTPKPANGFGIKSFDQILKEKEMQGKGQTEAEETSTKNTGSFVAQLKKKNEQKFGTQSKMEIEKEIPQEEEQEEEVEQEVEEEEEEIPAKVSPKLEVKPRIELKPKIEPKPIVETKPVVETKPIVQEKPKVEVKPKVQAKPKVQPKTKVQQKKAVITNAKRQKLEEALKQKLSKSDSMDFDIDSIDVDTSQLKGDVGEESLDDIDDLLAE
eukprot:TRINITY_DN1550_c0_g1_i5.p1 TRINITY_DN1550_c0_g1~~TRINITY_DN1550_c0_g1_i5.p1  ORF type:complete len:297 (+),score=137.77 TRINITY_DN1550_c0_g1_i5:842-1732(+)